jgi:poly(3-hydroxybutyrate) depolymerase
MAQLRWTADATDVGEVCERDFSVERQGHAIPGVLWQPTRSTGPRPLVLLGHGGSGHKRSAKMLRLGRMFSADYGWWAAAIDGPAHGGAAP